MMSPISSFLPMRSLDPVVLTLAPPSDAGLSTLAHPPRV
jgi:hypothetical protein